MKLKFMALAAPIVVPAALEGAVLAAPVHITFMHWGGESYDKRYDAMLADFMKQNPDIVVERLDPGSGANYDNKLAAMIAAGAPPDVYEVDMGDLITFNERAVDLTPFVKADMSFNYQQIPAVVRDIFALNGKIVGFPDNVSPNIYFFNVDLFRAAGIELPSDAWKRDAWTWEMLESDAKKLTKTDASGKVSVYGTQAGTGQALTRFFMWSNNAPEVDDVYHPTQSLYAQPNAIEAIAFVQRLHAQDHVAMPDGGKQRFQNGNIAMWGRWSSGISSFRNVTFPFGLAPYPKGPAAGARYASDVGTSGYIVDKDSKHIEAAAKLSLYMGSERAAKLIGELGPGIPIRPDAHISSFPKPLINGDDIYALSALPDRGNAVRLLSANQAALNDVVDEVLPQVYTGKISPKNGAEEIAQRQNAIINSTN
ncbi:MAG TPA: sugar ABC transporter substrate-binding protein [Limnochordia bacterium]|nr:sugar ABC transporter substrate-binding protein [Limnochordia bacterium]